MVHYDLSHLIQDESQRVVGPIQDDEALFLYSLIRGMRLERILEIGGLSGYSAQNFLKAVSFSQNATVYTVDKFPYVPKLADNHKVIIKDANFLTIADIDNKPIDLIFFDCHDMIQMEIYNLLYRNNIITDRTIIALHDTNLHYQPWAGGKHHPFDVRFGGYIHQPVERKMVSIFKNLGYDIFSINTTKDKHNQEFPFRHGITICQKFNYL